MKVRSGGSGEKEPRGCQLSFTLYSLESLPCVRALCLPFDLVTSSLHLLHPDLIHCTNDVNVNIPHLADTLFERTANSSWVVVFKALITTHHLMMYGNEVGGFCFFRLLLLLFLFAKKQPKQPRTATEQTLQGSQLKRCGKIALSGRRAERSHTSLNARSLIWMIYSCPYRDCMHAWSRTAHQQRLHVTGSVHSRFLHRVANSSRRCSQGS